MAYNYPQELVWIATQSASAVSSISFTTGISSNFKTYLVKIRDAIVSVNQHTIILTFSTNGGSSYLSSNYKSQIIANGSSLDNDTSTSAIIVNTDLSSTSSITNNCDVTLYNLSNSQVKTIYVYGGGWQAFNSVEATRIGASVQTGTTAVNAIKFAADSGTITANFYLYGVVE
jgi:hypothetical protein